MSQDSNVTVNPIPLIFDDVELPVVGFSVDRTVIVEGGEAQILTFNLSEPAPSGGLVVNIRVDDPDGDSGPGDTTFPPEFIIQKAEGRRQEAEGTHALKHEIEIRT
ncbi:MAG: hypothetical protein AAGG00_19765 [Cyanobacteria bacterium P01_H01_bin.150]